MDNFDKTFVENGITENLTSKTVYVYNPMSCDFAMNHHTVKHKERTATQNHIGRAHTCIPSCHTKGAQGPTAYHRIVFPRLLCRVSRLFPGPPGPKPGGCLGLQIISELDYRRFYYLEFISLLSLSILLVGLSMVKTAADAGVIIAALRRGRSGAGNALSCRNLGHPGRGGKHPVPDPFKGVSYLRAHTVGRQ